MFVVLRLNEEGKYVVDDCTDRTPVVVGDLLAACPDHCAMEAAFRLLSGGCERP